jgi:16S rRNA (guanine1207-N2)-methyltransferase
MAETDRLELAILSQEFDLPQMGDVIVLRAKPVPALDLFDPARLVCEQSFRPTYDALERRGVNVTQRAEGPAAMVVVNLTRTRAESLGNVARGLEMLETGGLLVVTGAKTDGVDSLARQVAKVLPLDGQFTKSHGRVFWLTRPATVPTQVAEWAEAATPRANGAGFLTAPGMFSPEHPDPGSIRLADAFDGQWKGLVADLGAGWGWLAKQALEKCPKITRIDLFEAEATALEASRSNLSDPRAEFIWSDASTLRATTEPYDIVICNPPFHHGRAAQPEIGAGFIAAAARILKPYGRLLLVANRQLPYEAELDARFRIVRRLSGDGAFKVIAADRPLRGKPPPRPPHTRTPPIPMPQPRPLI